MEFFEAPGFTNRLGDYLDDEQYRAMQQLLANNPELGDMIAGTGRIPQSPLG